MPGDGELLALQLAKLSASTLIVIFTLARPAISARSLCVPAVSTRTSLILGFLTSATLV
jgi:hypothetical protein